MEVNHKEITFDIQRANGEKITGTLICPVSGMTCDAKSNEPNSLDITIDFEGLEDDLKTAGNIDAVKVLPGKIKLELLLGNLTKP